MCSASRSADRRRRAGGLLRIRHAVGRFLSRHPLAYLPAVRLHLKLAGRRKAHIRPVTRDAELLIEGFPRSASTFAEFAFRMAQGRPVALAHHLHAAAHVIRAVRLGVPSLVIVREPAEAVASLLVRERHFGAAAALKSYVCFHRHVRPHRRGFVVATFEQVTGDFGTVIERINAAFRTGFRPFEHTEANVRRVFEAMAAAGPLRMRADQDFLLAGGWPLAEREQLKRQAARSLDDPALAGLLAGARTLYEEFSAWAR